MALNDRVSELVEDGNDVKCKSRTYFSQEESIFAKQTSKLSAIVICFRKYCSRVYLLFLMLDARTFKERQHNKKTLDALFAFYFESFYFYFVQRC